jgi:hypothetical protein
VPPQHVTSAAHMPRRHIPQAGLHVVPAPADFRTGLDPLDPAMKEWLGLLVFRLRGRALRKHS